MFAPTHHTLTGLDGQVVGDGTGQGLAVEVPSQYPTEVVLATDEIPATAAGYRAGSARRAGRSGAPDQAGADDRGAQSVTGGGQAEVEVEGRAPSVPRAVGPWRRRLL